MIVSTPLISLCSGLQWSIHSSHDDVDDSAPLSAMRTIIHYEAIELPLAPGYVADPSYGTMQMQCKIINATQECATAGEHDSSGMINMISSGDTAGHEKEPSGIVALPVFPRERRPNKPVKCGCTRWLPWSCGQPVRQRLRA